MADSQVTKRVTLSVEAKNNLAPGLAQSSAELKRSLAEMDREAARRAGFTAGGSKAAALAKQQAAAAKGQKDLLGGGGDAGGLIKSLNKSIGEESGLKKGLDALKGAGAVAGLAMAADALAKLSGAAKQFAVELALGEKTTGEVADGLVRQVPILGNIYTAGRNIRETLDGTAEAVERINRSAAAVDATAKAVRGVFADAKAMADSLNGERRQIQVSIDKEATLKGMPPWLRDATAKRIDLQVQLQANAEQLEKDIKAAREKALGAEGATRKAINGTIDPNERARLQKQLDDAMATAERQVRAAAARRDAALKSKFSLDTGVDFGQGQAEIAQRQAELDAEVRKAVGKAAVDVAGDGGAASKQLLADRIAAMQQEAALGDQAKGFEAERLAILAKYVEQVRALQELRRQGTGAEASEATNRIAGIAARQQAELADLDRRRAEAERLRIDQARDTAIERAATLRSIEIDSLRTQASLGNTAAEIEARKLEIREKYIAQERELDRLLAQRDLSEQDRAAAMAAKSSLAARQADEVRATIGQAAQQIDSIRVASVRAGESVELLAMREQLDANTRAMASTVRVSADATAATEAASRRTATADTPAAASGMLAQMSTSQAQREGGDVSAKASARVEGKLDKVIAGLAALLAAYNAAPFVKTYGARNS